MGGVATSEECGGGATSRALLWSTPSVPNYKSFQEFWRVKVFQVWPNLYDKIIAFMIQIKYH